MKKMKFKPKVLPICFQINIYEPKIYFGKKNSFNLRAMKYKSKRNGTHTNIFFL